MSTSLQTQWGTSGQSSIFSSNTDNVIEQVMAAQSLTYVLEAPPGGMNTILLLPFIQHHQQHPTQRSSLLLICGIDPLHLIFSEAC